MTTETAEGSAPTGVLADLLREPYRFDLLSTLRLLERSHPGKPRIGDSASREEDFVTLGENPFLEFPASNLDAAELEEKDHLRLFVRFLGLLGPQGALPLQVTDEAYGWWSNDHKGFARFLDLLNHRFLQLFFRAWADAHPIAQADRPAEDRFVAYVGSAIGVGNPAFLPKPRPVGAYPDAVDQLSAAGLLGFAGLLGAKARSGSRLAQAVEGLFGITCEVEEFVGSFLPLEKEDQSRVGSRFATLGGDCLVGANVFSIEDKIRLRLFARDLSEFKRFLPDGACCTPLADLLLFFLGNEIDCEAELAIPKKVVRPIRLSKGEGIRLGYTTWLVRAQDPSAEGHYRDTRFRPAERARRVASSLADQAEPAQAEPAQANREGDRHG
ncbi:type VI secretion system baseplate subunit TssG [Methylorubrum aminovorans]